MNRNGFTEQEAKDRMNAQMPLAMKVGKSDEVIDNSGTKEDLKNHLERIFIPRLME